MLRPDLLAGVSIVLAGAPVDADARRGADAGESLRAAVHAACAELGASVWECRLGFDGPSADVDDAAPEQAVDRVLAEAGHIEMLVVDCASLFTQAAAAGGPDDARTALRACLDQSWSVTRAVANGAFLPGGPSGGPGGQSGHGGRIVYLAPPPDVGEHADAARAGLENLARTLSIEWARHGITAVAIAPGAGACSAAQGGGRPGGATASASASATAAGEVAALTAYLASPAGAYFSGCLLDLRGAAGG